MARASKVQQVKHVVEGVALGVLGAGVEALTSAKRTLELNFNHTWRRWGPAARFPSVARIDPGKLFWGGVHLCGASVGLSRVGDGWPVDQAVLASWLVT